MIVECNQCQTRFQLDEARIPPQGIRVRCSRCKQAFFLKHPSASQSEVVDELAQQAASGEVGRAPDSTQDLSVESQVDSPDTAVSMTSPGLPTGVDTTSFSGSEFEEVEESDWEFIDELPAGGGGDDDIEEDPASGAVEASGSTVESAADEEASIVVGSAFSAEDLGEEPQTDEPAEDQSDFDAIGSSFSAEDFGEEPQTDEPAEGDVASSAIDGSPIGVKDLGEPAQADEAVVAEDGESESDSIDVSDRIEPAVAAADDRTETETPESVFGSVDDFSSLMEEEPEPASAAEGKSSSEAGSAAPVSDGELGEPEDWDFFSDDSLEESGLRGSAASTPSEASAPARQMDSAMEAGPSLGGYSDSEGALVQPKVDAPIRRIGRGVGWAITLGLLGLGIARGLLPRLQPGAGVPTAVDLGDFRAERVGGHWVETSSSDVLYKVTGQLRNTADWPAAPRAELEVKLLGPAGESLDLPAALAGVPMRDPDLRELPIERLRAIQRHAGWALSVTPVGVGETVPFAAWFDEVPDEAARFLLTLRASDPIPGGISSQPHSENAVVLHPASRAASPGVQVDAGE